MDEQKIQEEIQRNELILSKADMIQTVVESAMALADEDTIFVNPQAILRLWRTEFLEHPLINTLLQSPEDLNN